MKSLEKFIHYSYELHNIYSLLSRIANAQKVCLAVCVCVCVCN